MVVTQLGKVPRRGKNRLFQQILERTAGIDGTLLLVFDEAHLFDGDALTDLRLLISSAMDVAPPLKILLTGHDPLRAVLRRSRHADLFNRISARSVDHLNGRTEASTVVYSLLQHATCWRLSVPSSRWQTVRRRWYVVIGY